MKLQSLIGLKFNRLTPVSYLGIKKGGPMWMCRCDCGNFKEVHSTHLKRGRTKSCGCLNSEVTSQRNMVHGFSIRGKRSPAYKTWASIKTRCLNSRDKNFKKYGGAGIIMCDDWKNFVNFYRDMGERLVGTSIDRIDNSKGYYKENCRWASPRTQAINRHRTIMIEFGSEKKCLSDWAKKLNIRPCTLKKRLVSNGWNVEDAFLYYSRG